MAGFIRAVRAGTAGRGGLCMFGVFWNLLPGLRPVVEALFETAGVLARLEARLGSFAPSGQEPADGSAYRSNETGVD